jgi:unsaturated chondroitin disaccharide hydrolase
MTVRFSPWHRIAVALVTAVIASPAASQKVHAQAKSAQATLPRTVLMRADELSRVRVRVRAGDPAFAAAMKALRVAADSALVAGPWAVTDKRMLPPGGDARDYQSFGPYWWPDSTKPNGMPYIRRDGLMNPVMRRESDAPRLYAMLDAVETLALSHWFTGDERHAARAAFLLRRFFLDSATGMRPHLRYGQAIPGVTPGRGIGLIDTRDMARLADGVAMLRLSRSWTAADDTGMQRWGRAFLDWMLTSAEGKDEQDETNNHGTWYDAQAVALALFVGDSAGAKRMLRDVAATRFEKQLAFDGSQPDEIARTRPLHYSVFNLEAMTRLAEMGRHVGVDLWSWRSEKGVSLTRAVRFVAPYADTAVPFPKADVTPVEPVDIVRVLRRTAFATGDSAVAAAISRSPAALRIADRSVLMYSRVRGAAVRGAATNRAARGDSLAPLIARALAHASSRLARTADARNPADGWPRLTKADGSWETRPATSWTSGFFPGALWYMYELTLDMTWRTRAERWTEGLEPMSRVTTTHDLGFVLFDSFGNGWRLTGNPAYRDVLLRGASTLAKRFNPKVGAIKSWDTERVEDARRVWPYPVIVDNLMNLELLYWAARNGGDTALAALATRHAATSRKVHVRSDGSTAHVAVFDPESGTMLRQATWQGYADSSVWARGQAWAIHGLTAAYRESRDPALLAGAQAAADWWVKNLPADGVPYWDFRHPGIPRVERDASAAAIAASGLYELAELSRGADRARYRRAADASLAALCRRYTTANSAMESVLAHSVGGRPQEVEVDVGLSYADYFFIEAIVRRRGSSGA